MSDDCNVCRRDLLKMGAAGLTWGFFGLTLPNLLFLREAYGVTPQNPLYDAAIQIFYDGGPSQTDTWDPKPGSANNVFPTVSLGSNDKYGKPIMLGDQMTDFAKLIQGDPAHYGLGIFRSMVHRNGAHGPAQQWMNCFWMGGTQAGMYPSTACVMAWYYQGQGLGIPSVLIAGGGNGQDPNNAKGNPVPTALMVQVGQSQAQNPVVQALSPPVPQARYDRRKRLIAKINERFTGSRPDEVVKAYDRAWMDAYNITSKGEAAKAFDLTGKTILPPGKGVPEAEQLTLAQELVKAGVPYVACGIPGNDSHSGNMATIKNNWGTITGPAVTQMAKNLQATGKRVLILMGGEFGRTPDTVASGRDGRDHHPDGFSWAMLSINQPKFKTGAWGNTGPDGMFQEAAGTLVDPTHPADVGALLYRGLGFNVGQDITFDIPMAGRPGAPPVDRVNNSTPIMQYFGLA